VSLLVEYDTTALIILAKTNHLNLLINLIDKVYVPKAVMEEIQYKNDMVKALIESSDFLLRYKRLVIKKYGTI